MDFSFLILEYLKQQGQVPVPGFGTFYLKNTNAVVDEAGKSILPPGKEVAFQPGNSPADASFINFVAQQKNIPLIDAEMEIKKQTTSWNSVLKNDGKLVIENIGTFILEDTRIHFTGNRTENPSPDFYGLEEINLSEIKDAGNLPQSVDHNTPYRFSKTAYWLVPLLISLSLLAYYLITQPELVLGEKSFATGLPTETDTKIVKEPVPSNNAEKDSLSEIHQVKDSAKAESLKSETPAPFPVKKQSSQNTHRKK